MTTYRERLLELGILSLLEALDRGFWFDPKTGEIWFDSGPPAPGIIESRLVWVENGDLDAYLKVILTRPPATP